MRTVTIVDFRQSENTKVLSVKIDKEFKQWFCKVYSLKRWSSKKFKKVFLESTLHHREEYAVLNFDKIEVVTE